VYQVDDDERALASDDVGKVPQSGRRTGEPSPRHEETDGASAFAPSAIRLLTRTSCR
jgi:hypothetical protein